MGEPDGDDGEAERLIWRWLRRADQLVRRTEPPREAAKKGGDRVAEDEDKRGD